ncbi:hypothetical protein F4823DRAFT_569366 [Ustulina deusta]|nr:hypothetical protein F4823DRAFT_569366 [Ustulina deusta]
MAILQPVVARRIRNRNRNRNQSSRVTEMVFQVLMDPKLLADLRDEVMLALEEHGWTEKLLRKLALQDSFIRELNRLYPTGASECFLDSVLTAFLQMTRELTGRKAGCSRLVVDENFTFSNGLAVVFLH